MFYFETLNSFFFVKFQKKKFFFLKNSFKNHFMKVNISCVVIRLVDHYKNTIFKNKKFSQKNLLQIAIRFDTI